MSAQTGVSAERQATGRIDTRKRAIGHTAALEWLASAVQTVSAVYPAVNFGTSVPPDIDQAFQDAWAAYWFAGTITLDEMREAWRAYYRSCL